MAAARCTARGADGAAVLAAGATQAEALERLAAHEELAQSVRDRAQEVEAQIEGLRAAGKVKTVTYRQLVGIRTVLREMVGYYEERGL